MSNPFKSPPKFGAKLKKLVEPSVPKVNTDHTTDMLHELKQQIGKRRTSLYANPGEKLVNETDKPSYFTGIKRLLRSRYGGN